MVSKDALAFSNIKAFGRSLSDAIDSVIIGCLFAFAIHGFPCLFLFRRNDHTALVRDPNTASGFVHIMRVRMKYVPFSNSRLVESELRDKYIGILISQSSLFHGDCVF
jgi:hypothetical protein